MLSRLFSQTLPAPTEIQTETMLKFREISLTSEIISAAYEPRFQLYALGTADCGLIVINNKHQCFKSVIDNDRPPALKLIPLINSSSFFSICSKKLFENHSSRKKENVSNDESGNTMKLKRLNEIKSTKIQSSLTHWIVSSNGVVVSRTARLKMEIIDVTASPIHPEFVLLLAANGALYGYSVEEMKFTDLYLNVFEGKKVNAIFCPFGMKFFVCHDVVEKIDMQSKEISKSINALALSIDMINEKTVAILDFKGIPKLLNGSKVIHSADKPAICSNAITEKDYIYIIRKENDNKGNNGDVVYINDKVKFELYNEYLVPNVITIYNKPFQRQDCTSVAVITDYGRFMYMNGNAIDHFILKPISPRIAFSDHLQNIYVFENPMDPTQTTMEVIVFRHKNYSGKFKYDSNNGIPIAILNDEALSINSEKHLLLINLKTGNKKALAESPLLAIQTYPEYIDFVIDKHTLYRFEILTKNKLVKEEIKIGELPSAANQSQTPENTNNDGNTQSSNPSEEQEKPQQQTPETTPQENQNHETHKSKPTPQVNSPEKSNKIETIPSYTYPPNSWGYFWKSFGSSFIYIPKDASSNMLTFENQQVEAVDKNEAVIMLDVINDQGIPNTKGNFIVLVTTHHVNIFAIAEKGGKLKRVRHVSTPSAVNDAIIASWGVLILKLVNALHILALPDPTYGIATLPLDQTKTQSNQVLLMKGSETGAISFEGNAVVIYSKSDELPPVFDIKSMPPLEPPQPTGMKKLFGNKTITIKDADESFMYNRPKNPPGPNEQPNQPEKAQTAMSSLSETQDILQQLLVKANERGEALNELEIKADRLLKSAQQFHDTIRKFRKL